MLICVIDSLVNQSSCSSTNHQGNKAAQSRQKAAVTLRGWPSRPLLWSCLLGRLFLHWSSCHYCHYRFSLLSLVLALAEAQRLKRPNPADRNGLEAAQEGRCWMTDTALLDKNFNFSKSDMGRDNYSLWRAHALYHMLRHMHVLCIDLVYLPFWSISKLNEISLTKMVHCGEWWLSMFASVDPL